MIKDQRSINYDHGWRCVNDQWWWMAMDQWLMINDDWTYLIFRETSLRKGKKAPSLIKRPYMCTARNLACMHARNLVMIRAGRSTAKLESEWSVTTMLKIAIFRNVTELATTLTISQFRNDIYYQCIDTLSSSHIREMGFKIKVLERAKCMQGNMWADGREIERIEKSKKEIIRKNKSKRENEKT